MSIDLEHQLAVYGEYLTELAPAVTPDVESLGPAIRRRSYRQGFAIAAGAAATVLLVIGSLILLAPFSGEQTPPASDPATITTTILTAEAWNPILSETRAKPAPPAATCPPGANPDAPGPGDQERPYPSWVGNLAGTFDQRRGRIVYVDVTGETWTFDVCINTWQRMNPETPPVPPEDLYDDAGGPSGALGQLAYDVDSDVTVALGPAGVSVYDADANTWTRHGQGADEDGDPLYAMGAVYDPVSGLIVTSTVDGDRWELWAYNVDTNQWTLMGPVPFDRDTPCCTQIDLLGYSPAIDSFILVTYVDNEEATLLLNPRTGETTLIATDTPIVDLGWPSAVYGPANDTVYVSTSPSTVAVCGFDANASTWRCFDSPPQVATEYRLFAAAVGDPMNNRLILINGVHGDWWSSATNDVWAIDLVTGGWIELLPPG